MEGYLRPQPGVQVQLSIANQMTKPKHKTQYMEARLQRFGAVLFAVLLLTSVMGAAAAATWDTETTSTSTTSDVSGASNTLTWYAGNETETVYFEVDGAGTSDLTLELSNGADAIDTVYYENATADTENSSAGHYSWTVTHAELSEELPSHYSSSTYEVEVINNTDGSVVTNTSLTLAWDGTETTARVAVANDSRSVDSIGDDLSADSLEVENQSTWFGFGAEKTTSTYRDDVAVDGNNTTVQMDLMDPDAADSMSSAAEGHDDGERIYDARFVVSSSTAEAQLAPVYKNEAPSDPPTDTYVVYDTSKDRLELTTASAFDDATTLHVTGVAGEGYSFGEALSAFGIDHAIGQSISW